MDPVSVSITIDRPRDAVFAYLADIANHAEFTDHFLVDWRLLDIETVGRGAGARFRVKAPLQRFSGYDATFIEVEPPRRIVEAGRGGKFNRVRTRGVWALEAPSAGATRVEFTFASKPATISDRLLEALGGRGFLKRKHRKALKRLRSILEEGRDRGTRATIAGG